MHDASKVLLGSTRSSAKDISTHDVDPANFPAGLGVCLNSSGGLSLDISDGRRIGISLGKSLSDTKKTSVVRTGEGVPLRVSLPKANAAVTISSYANLVSGTADTLLVGSTTFTAQAGAATPGEATFQAASSDEATATSLAAQINAHADASALVVASVDGDEVTITAIEPGDAGNEIALEYTDNDTNVGITIVGADDDVLSGGDSAPSWMNKGAKAYIHDTEGKLDDPAGDTALTDATIVSGLLVGVDEAGLNVDCVLVDMPGGL
jgi:hypothetical protein